MTRQYVRVTQPTFDNAAALALRFATLVPLEFASSPLYSVLGPAVAEDRALMETIVARGEFRDAPNLLFAAIHFLVLGNPDDPLADFFASIVGEGARDPAEVVPVVQAFCDENRSDLTQLLM